MALIMQLRKSLSTHNLLDIFSKIFNQKNFFACSHKAALVTASRNYEKKFLSRSILEKMSKKFCLESDILSYMIRALNSKTLTKQGVIFIFLYYDIRFGQNTEASVISIVGPRLRLFLGPEKNRLNRKLHYFFTIKAKNKNRVIAKTID